MSTIATPGNGYTYFLIAGYPIVFLHSKETERVYYWYNQVQWSLHTVSVPTLERFEKVTGLQVVCTIKKSS